MIVGFAERVARVDRFKSIETRVFVLENPCAIERNKDGIDGGKGVKRE